MALATRLQVKQGQGLVMTARLGQAISLLQLSNLELGAYVDSEVERNPLLTLEAPPGARAPDDAAAPPSQANDRAPGRIASPGAGRRGVAGGLAEAMEGVLSRPPTLMDHLEDQAALCGFEPGDRAVASALIGAVDEAGYLRADLEDLALRLGCARQRLDRVLERLQGLEPVGVFARDVRECLMLQLKDRNRCDPAMIALLDHLHLLARQDLAALRRACGVDHEDLVQMIGELRGLSPRPGAAFGAEPAAPMVPDVFVRAGGDGLWRVELNGDTLPRLLVDHRYHAEVRAMARTDQEKAFVSDCLIEANWLTRSLDQRAATLLKVASEVVRRQDGFLVWGAPGLRPLTLKTVAEAVGLHESTVSRAAAGKSMATPRGVFEMKFFFDSAVASRGGGQAHSAESVRHRIKQLIGGEPQAREVLSDDRIVDILKRDGVEIARRTVAKYRDDLQIPSSAERRRRLRDSS
jgi:RNA polymerase sigma-54 factor